MQKKRSILAECTHRADPNGQRRSGGVLARRTPHEDFILAYYSIWILATLRSEEAMEERLKSITGDLVDNMAIVVTFLLDDLPDNDRLYLGVSRPTSALGIRCARSMRIGRRLFSRLVRRRGVTSGLVRLLKWGMVLRDAITTVGIRLGSQSWMMRSCCWAGRMTSILRLPLDCSFHIRSSSPT